MLELLNELRERCHDIAIFTLQDAVELSKKADNERVQFIFYGDLDIIAYYRTDGNNIKMEEVVQFNADIINTAIEDTDVLSAIRSFGLELVIMDAAFPAAVLLQDRRQQH